MTNPFARFSWNQVAQQGLVNGYGVITISSAHLEALQESRKGMRHVESFRKAVADLLAELKARGPPADDDHSIGALLLKIVDPNTGDAPGAMLMSCNVNGSHSLLPGPSLVEKMNLSQNEWILILTGYLAERGLSDDQLKAEIGTMIMGGFETTAHTLAFTIFCIATNPAAEASVVAELQGLGLLATSSQPNPRQLQHTDLKGMPYINNAIKEAMRMFPVVAGFPR